MLTIKWFYADDVPHLVEQVNEFLATLPKVKVKDVQIPMSKTCQIGENMVFGALVIYEV